MKFAAIDIGSNAIRLLIASVTSSDGKIPLKKIALTRVPVRLGEDVFSEDRISDHKTGQLIKSLQAFKLLMEVHDVVDYRACATSAMREAKNGGEVARALYERSGVAVERIDGSRESELIVSTYLDKISDSQSEFLYIDVGGGSTEVTLISGGKPVSGRSFPIGTVRELAKGEEEEEMEKLKQWCRSLRGSKALTALGTGGNINKLRNLLGTKKESPIQKKELLGVADELKALSYEERMKNFDLKPDRADVIVPASNIYLTVMEETGVDRILVPKVGLADGIITQLYKDHYT